MYTLRFPFTLPLGRAITEHLSELGQLTLSLTRQDSSYVLTIKGFPTEETAKGYINKVWAGLMWTLLHLGFSPGAIWELQNVKYADDPDQTAINISQMGLHIEGPVDMILHEALPAVYPTGKRFVTGIANPLNATVTTPAEHVFKYFMEAVAFPASAEVVEDANLRVALDLYGTYFTELSANARFLALVMALEALATGVLRTQLVLDLLDKWKKEAEELQKTVEPGSDDAISLDAVIRELLFRKEDSIRRQIRRLVSTTLQTNGDADALEMARSAVRVYDLRSTLVHDGKLESQVLSIATLDAKNIVERVLRARFLQNAGER